MEEVQRPYSSAGKGEVARMLDMFSQPPIEAAIERFYLEEIELETAVTRESRQLTFKCPPTNQFTDLQATKLEFTIKITRANGGNIPAQHPQNPANAIATAPGYRANVASDPGAGFDQLTHATVFRECDIRIGQTSISPMTGLYPHTALFQTILSYQRDAVKSKLPLQGFYPEADPNESNVFSVGGFSQRAALTQQSRLWTLSGPIHHGLFFQERLLLPMCPLSVTLTLADPVFCMKSGIADADYRFEITDAKLVFKRVVVNPSIQAAFENRLTRQPCTYPINHIRTQSFLIGADKRSFTVPDVFGGGFIPRRVYVALCPQANQTGSYTTSPFKYSHNNVRDMFFRQGAMRSPAIPFDVDFARPTPRFDRLYNALFGNSNQLDDSGLMILPRNFADSYCIFSFDFGQNDSPDAFLPKQISPCLFQVAFTANVPATLTMLLFSVSEQVIEIDAARNPLLNFAL